MKGNRLRTCALIFCALWLRASIAAQPTTLIVHHNANLRADHSTQSTIKDHLEPGDELTLLEPTKTLGFWHVRTADGVEGWVYQTLVHVEEVDEVPTVPPATSAVATAVDPTWDKPTPTGPPFPGPPGSSPCPADGEAGGDLETNRRKNRTDPPATVHQVTFGALMALPDPDASTNRNNWTAAQKAVIAPFEGAAVSVVGFIVAVKKQYGGSGESTNCHFNKADFVDAHVALVESAGQGEEKALVVEPTPRFYATHPTWKWATLNDLDHSLDPVRITGWLLFDPVHKGHLGTFRASLWEIHPITKIEVFRNGQWTVW